MATERLGAAPAVSANPTAAQAALGNASERGKLRGLALQAASVAGVLSPRTMHAVAAADHQVAERALSGAEVDDHAPVYVITLTGGPFTATRHPPGVAPPKGNVMTLTVDAATHRITDVGYVDAEPELTQIGSAKVDLAAQ